MPTDKIGNGAHDVGGIFWAVVRITSLLVVEERQRRVSEDEVLLAYGRILLAVDSRKLDLRTRGYDGYGTSYNCLNELATR